MFKLYSRKDIDEKKWDDCILHSKQGILYGLSWYMDIVSPGWEALIEEDEIKYVAVVPLPVKKRLGFKFIYRPFLTQQLGLFSSQEFNNKAVFSLILEKILKVYKQIYYTFNTDNNLTITEEVRKIEVKRKVTYHLSLQSSYQQLSELYSTNQSRNIKKAFKRNIEVSSSENIFALTNIIQNCGSAEFDKISKKQYDIINKIYLESTKRGISKLLFAKNSQGEILAGGLFLFFNNKIIYLLGASNAEGKATAAMALVFDFIIKEYSNTNFVLDFEGSEVEGIANFYKGFGASLTNYPVAVYTNSNLFLRPLFN